MATINHINDEKIDSLKTDLAREKSERYTDRSVCELKSFVYDKLDALKTSVDIRFDGVNSSLCAQNVWNATNTATINCLTDKLNNVLGLLTYGVASDKVINSTTTSTT